MATLQLYRATLLAADGDARLHVLVVPTPNSPGRPRHVIEPLLDALRVEDQQRIPPFFLPSVVASIAGAEPGATRERIVEMWFSATTPADPKLPDGVRRFVASAMEAEIAPLGQTLAGAATAASTADGALFGGFLRGSDRPLAALALPASVTVCTADADAVEPQLEAWLRAGTA